MHNHYRIFDPGQGQSFTRVAIKVYIHFVERIQHWLSHSVKGLFHCYSFLFIWGYSSFLFIWGCLLVDIFQWNKNENHHHHRMKCNWHFTSILYFHLNNISFSPNWITDSTYEKSSSTWNYRIWSCWELACNLATGPKCSIYTTPLEFMHFNVISFYRRIMKASS